MAEASLGAASSPLTLVTHYFEAAGDDSVNADEHFGSDERTLRFVAVALPTLIEQLAARAAIVALPWDLEGEPSLTVIAVTASVSAAWQTRALTRLEAGPGPPFWRLEPGLIDSPPQVAAVAAGLSIPASGG